MLSPESTKLHFHLSPQPLRVQSQAWVQTDPKIITMQGEVLNTQRGNKELPSWEVWPESACAAPGDSQTAQCCCTPCPCSCHGNTSVPIPWQLTRGDKGTPWTQVGAEFVWFSAMQTGSVSNWGQLPWTARCLPDVKIYKNVKYLFANRVWSGMESPGSDVRWNGKALNQT